MHRYAILFTRCRQRLSANRLVAESCGAQALSTNAWRLVPGRQQTGGPPLAQRGGVRVALGQDRLGVSGPGDAQCRVERVDGVLALRGCSPPSTGTSPSNHLPAQGRRGPGPRRGRSVRRSRSSSSTASHCPNGRGADPNVDHHVEHRPAQACHVLGLARRQLGEVHTAQHARRRHRAVGLPPDRSRCPASAVNAGSVNHSKNSAASNRRAPSG